MAKSSKKPETKVEKKAKVTSKPPGQQVPASSKSILAKARAAQQAKEAKAAASSSDSSEEESEEESKPPKANGKAPAKKPVSDDSDSDSESSEDEKPKSTPKANGKQKEESSSEESSEEDSSEDEKPKAQQVKKVAKPASSSSDSDSDSDSSEDESEKKPVPTKKAAPKKPELKKVESSDSEDDSDSSEDEDDKPKAKILQKDDSSSSDSSEDEAPKKTAAAKRKKEESSDSSDESDSDSDSDSDAEMGDSTKPAAANGKRKANDDPAPSKKVKLANGDAADPNETTSIFVGQLSWNVDNDWLAQEFQQCGEVVSATVQMDRNSGRSRGFGYVHFSSSQAVEAALKLNGKEIDGRAIKVDISTPPNKDAQREKRAKTFGDQTSPPSSTLFVGNLSFNSTEDSVWEVFNQWGVKSVRLPTDRDTGRPKGFGYVEFDDVEGAKKAFEACNGQDIDGRSVRLDFSQPRDSAGGGGGRGGFGGGFGGGGRGGGFGGGFGGGRGGGGRGRGGGDRGGRGGRGGGGRGGRGGGRGGNPVRSGAIVHGENKKKITFGDD
ncbi:RNA-binding domain-containing protein [Dendrothele bispora CBS 962.96]|uniref:RNA-binding domain-containing protein n=1 Tax=Dendrothele bispora (strain CBS 962.96) TaxID=1314807 RepID=A0A4S8MNJ8_DENBC|nr:RNA-binding domain-containing protein [Dendrothele bispora CBS 962.96]